MAADKLSALRQCQDGKSAWLANSGADTCAGRRTLFGPVAGAFFMVTLENYLTTIGQWVFVVQGVIFVVCVLLFRRGIIGELAHLLRVKL